MAKTILLVLLLGATAFPAVSLKLKNGRQFTGEPVEEKSTALVLQVEGTPITVFKTTIAAVDGVPYNGKGTILKPGSIPAANNPEAVRGIQAYFRGAYDSAYAALRQAAARIPGTGEVLWYLGLAAERADRAPEARAAYRELLECQPEFPAAGLVRSRLAHLQNQEFARAAQRAAAGPAPAAAPAGTTLAIMDFFNKGTNREWDLLGRGLAEALAADLGRIRSLRVVERDRLAKLRRELKPGAGDTAQNQRLARLAGATQYLSGTLENLKDGRLHLRLALTTVASGQSKPLDPMSCNLNNIFFLEKQVAFDLADRLGAAITAEDMNRLDAVPTKSIPAYFAYLRGLDIMDQGQWDAALKEFERARQLDGRFDLALARSQECIALSQPCPSLEEMEKAYYLGSVQPGKGRKK